MILLIKKTHLQWVNWETNDKIKTKRNTFTLVSNVDPEETIFF